MFTISQLSETEWEIVGPDGQRVGDVHATYDLAVAFLGGMLTYAHLAAGDDSDAEASSEDGLLPETWISDPALCFSEPTGDGRDFSECVWSSRDVNQSTLPLMLQTSTDFGHFGAQLAGFVTNLANLGAGSNPTGGGRFYDSEAGRAFRDMLLAGRSFGVSVDPGRVEVDWECTAEDEDGYCVAEVAMFRSYEIIGVTGTPFPGFAAAAIRLGDAVTAAAPAPVRTPIDLRGSGVDLTRPPREWFYTPEPAFGEPFALGSMGDEWLVDQGDGRVAMPLTITDDGRFAGHLAVDGACHVGYPGTCVTPPSSPSNYARFHVGETLTAEGDRVAIGAFSAGCDHAASHLRAADATDHYAHNGVAWANARVTAGEHGPWTCGAIRHDVTAEQLAIYRAGALSGDWRHFPGGLDLIAALAVTTPGFTIAREAMTAAGALIASAPRVRASMDTGVQMSLVASGIVRRCPDCARRSSAEASRQLGGRGARPPAEDQRLVGMERTLALIERRTRHLTGPAAEHAAQRIRG